MDRRGQGKEKMRSSRNVQRGNSAGYIEAMMLGFAVRRGLNLTLQMLLTNKNIHNLCLNIVASMLSDIYTPLSAISPRVSPVFYLYTHFISHIVVSETSTAQRSTYIHHKMGGKKGGGENSKKVAGNARVRSRPRPCYYCHSVQYEMAWATSDQKANGVTQKAEAAASKKAAEDAKLAAEEEKQWAKGSKSSSKKWVSSPRRERMLNG